MHILKLAFLTPYMIQADRKQDYGRLFAATAAAYNIIVDTDRVGLIRKLYVSHDLANLLVDMTYHPRYIWHEKTSIQIFTYTYPTSFTL